MYRFIDYSLILIKFMYKYFIFKKIEWCSKEKFKKYYKNVEKIPLKMS